MSVPSGERTTNISEKSRAKRRVPQAAQSLRNQARNSALPYTVPRHTMSCGCHTCSYLWCHAWCCGGWRDVRTFLAFILSELDGVGTSWELFEQWRQRSIVVPAATTTTRSCCEQANCVATLCDLGGTSTYTVNCVGSVWKRRFPSRTLFTIQADTAATPITQHKLLSVLEFACNGDCTHAMRHTHTHIRTGCGTPQDATPLDIKSRQHGGAQRLGVEEAAKAEAEERQGRVKLEHIGSCLEDAVWCRQYSRRRGVRGSGRVCHTAPTPLVYLCAARFLPGQHTPPCPLVAKAH